MINNIKLNLKDLLVFFVSVLLLLYLLVYEKKQYITEVLIYYPKVPSVYFNSDRKILDISLKSEKVYTPYFGRNLTTLQIDSTLSKMNKRCDLYAKVYNYVPYESYIRFTIEAEDPNLIDKCYNKIKNFYDQEWEKDKNRSIEFLKKSIHSFSKFSYLFHDEAIKSSEIKEKDFKKINGCRKIWEVPDTIIHIKKIIYEVCGNFYRIILIDKKTNSKLKMENNLLTILNDDFKTRGFKTHFIKDDQIILPIFLEQNVTIVNLFSEKNFNKEVLKILKLIEDKNYLASLSTFEPEQDFILDYDSETGYTLGIENKSLFLKNLSSNLYDSYKKTHRDIIKYTEDFIRYTFLNSKKEALIPDDFKNSKLIWVKSKYFLINTTKSLESFWLFFTAIVLSIFIMLFQKIILMFFNLKQNEKK